MGVSLHYLAPFFLLIEGVTYNYIHTTLSPRQHLRLQHGWFKVRSLKWGGSPSHESWTSVLTKICVTVSINTVQLWSPNFLSTLIFPCYRWPVPLGITVLTMVNTEQIYLGLQKQVVSVGHTLGPNTRFNLSPLSWIWLSRPGSPFHSPVSCVFLVITQVLIIIPFKFIELFTHVFFKPLGIFDEAYDFLKFYVLGAHHWGSHWRTLRWTSVLFGWRGHIPVVLAFHNICDEAGCILLSLAVCQGWDSRLPQTGPEHRMWPRLGLEVGCSMGGLGSDGLPRLGCWCTGMPLRPSLEFGTMQIT